MKDSQLLGIKDEWCREMASQAMKDAEEIDARITTARGRRLARQTPEVVLALDKEIAALQRIKEELENDIQHWSR
ncbi:MAG TPA: hypothetical protein VE641_03945 [Chthoniobacterales bacterium]|jgi:hypothetical protein|nr:hypothetical protein [Chthoniobacterales bacterium]